MTLLKRKKRLSLQEELLAELAFLVKSRCGQFPADLVGAFFLRLEEGAREGLLRGESFPCVGLEQSLHEVEALSSVLRDYLVTVQHDLALSVELVCLLVIFALDRVASQEQHMRHNAETEQIAFGVVRSDEGELIQEDLGCHVADRPAFPEMGLISCVRVKRKSKIQDAALLFPINMYILRLDIPMYDPPLVQIPQTSQYRREDTLNLFQGQLRIVLDECQKISALHLLDDQHVLVVLFVKLEQLGGVGVIFQTSENSSLLKDYFFCGFVVTVQLVDLLSCVDLAIMPVLNCVNLNKGKQYDGKRALAEWLKFVILLTVVGSNGCLDDFFFFFCPKAAVLEKEQTRIPAVGYQEQMSSCRCLVPFNVPVLELAMSLEGSKRLLRVEEAILVDGEVTDHFKAQYFPVFSESISLQSSGHLWHGLGIFGPKRTSIIEREVAKGILWKRGE